MPETSLRRAAWLGMQASHLRSEREFQVPVQVQIKGDSRDTGDYEEPRAGAGLERC